MPEGSAPGFLPFDLELIHLRFLKRLLLSVLTLLATLALEENRLKLRRKDVQ